MLLGEKRPIISNITSELLEYDVFNQLVQVKNDKGTTTYAYGDNPLKINERKNPSGLNVYTYMPDISAIRQSTNLYVYTGNNPIMYKDSNGQFWDIVLDIGSLIWGIGDFIAEPSWGNAGMVGLDIVGAIVPFVPSAGVKVGVKALTKADDVVDAAKAIGKADNVVDAGKAVSKA